MPRVKLSSSERSQASWSNNNACDMHTGGALFKYHAGHNILARDFCVFLHSLLTNARITREIRPHIICNSFTKHPTIQFYILWATDSSACPQCPRGRSAVQLHSFWTLVLDGGKWANQCPSCFMCLRENAGTHQIRVRVGPRNDVDILEKKNILFLSGIKFQFIQPIA